MDRDGAGAPMRRTTIAVDGGVFEHYTAYRGYVRAHLDKLLGAQARAAMCPLHVVPRTRLRISVCNSQFNAWQAHQALLQVPVCFKPCLNFYAVLDQEAGTCSDVRIAHAA